MWREKLKERELRRIENRKARFEHQIYILSILKYIYTYSYVTISHYMTTFAWALTIHCKSLLENDIHSRANNCALNSLNLYLPQAICNPHCKFYKHLNSHIINSWLIKWIDKGKLSRGLKFLQWIRKRIRNGSLWMSEYKKWVLAR